MLADLTVVVWSSWPCRKNIGSENPIEVLSLDHRLGFQKLYLKYRLRRANRFPNGFLTLRPDLRSVRPEGKAGHRGKKKRQGAKAEGLRLMLRRLGQRRRSQGRGQGRASSNTPRGLEPNA